MLLHGLRFMIKFNLWQGDVVHVILHFTRQQNQREHAGDVIIQADVNRYDNKVLLWKAFTSRDLGVNVANHDDGSTVPGC